LFAADTILRTAPGGAGCAAGRSVAFGARGSGVRRSGTPQVETVPIDRSPFWLDHDGLTLRDRLIQLPALCGLI